MAVRPVKLDIFRADVPIRSFEHAAARRTRAQGIVVRASFSDGSQGWGETLPRDYVTGESLDSVISDLSERLWPVAREIALSDDATAESLGALDEAAPEDRCINAARCAMELAMLWRTFGNPPRRPIRARVSGVLGSTDPAKTARRLRLMRLYGLRDFKLKLGFGDEIDTENLRVVHGRLDRAIRRGRATLRVDVNGGWDADTTPQRVADLRPFGVCVVEHPVFCPAADLANLARRCSLPLMADESLLTFHDAEALLEAGDRVWWNVRISKNGGMRPSMRLADLAARRGVPFTLGCMVGETSILSAFQRLMLQTGPTPRFVEGNYGRFLLADDLVKRPLRFGYGGRLRPLRALPKIDPARLARNAELVETLNA